MFSPDGTLISASAAPHCGIAEKEEELAKAVVCLDKASTAYQCREDQSDGKQHQWHQHRYQTEWTEA